MQSAGFGSDCNKPTSERHSWDNQGHMDMNQVLDVYKQLLIFKCYNDTEFMGDIFIS